jgi:hypothetical protein
MLLSIYALDVKLFLETREGNADNYKEIKPIINANNFLMV